MWTEVSHRARCAVFGLMLAGSVLGGEAAPESPPAQISFAAWLDEFKQSASRRGISAATLDAALGSAAPLPRVIELDRSQPEFGQTFLAYLEHRVTPRQIARGQNALAENAALFDAVEARYGVPRTVLAAFWGLETGYGATLGDFSVPAVLATLAYEGRRRDFFRGQLVDALKILDAGHVTVAGMQGSWAGAMGQVQFMPSTFRAYAVDGDNDARIDVWRSLADAMHSAGNYLARAGWRANEPVAIEVQLRADFDWRKSGLKLRLPVSEWAALGVRPALSETLPRVAGQAAIVLPQGYRGPAFMVFDNFDVVMQWNRSPHYALTVAYLADRLGGGAALASGRDAEREALTSEALRALQRALSELGFDAGVADGLPGPRTEAAVRRFQITRGLPADGYASPSLWAQLQTAHAEAKAAGKLACAPFPSAAEPCN